MAIYERDEILAYKIGNDIVCLECVEQGETITEDDIYTKDDLEDGQTVFCDRCKELIA